MEKVKVEYSKKEGNEVGEERWKSFWFEGKMAWGQIKNSKDWDKIKTAYSNDLDKLRKAQRCDGSSVDYFGFAPECCGFETLGEFADKNGMKL